MLSMTKVVRLVIALLLFSGMVSPMFAVNAASGDQGFDDVVSGNPGLADKDVNGLHLEKISL